MRVVEPASRLTSAGADCTRVVGDGGDPLQRKKSNEWFKARIGHPQRWQHGQSFCGYKKCKTTSPGRAGGVLGRQQAGLGRDSIWQRERCLKLLSFIIFQR